MPSTSEKQRRFMGAELGRKRAGKKTQTGMSEQQLSEFAGAVSKSRKEKPGRSLIDIEYHEGADGLKKLDGGIVHSIHKLKGPIVWGSEEFDMDGKASVAGNKSALRDIGNGIHYGAEVIDRGPETEFRVEEINPQHYGRDYEPTPYKDMFKTNYKSRELNIRNEADKCYQECETPGAVSGEFESSLAYGTTGFRKIPVENPDNRAYESQQKYARTFGEFEEKSDDDDEPEVQYSHR